MKIINVLRNPKGVACSYYTYLCKVETDEYNGSIDRYVVNITESGIIGDWKNILTVTQNETFDALYKEKISDMGINIEFDYE
ncbi:Sulfotransferase family cytosolic 1B member 1 [Mizuhopecten yessoensis]|uniref:Sulfotransferase family cytosolic 1B member 1 n=1 Tax=Mizuhopecten yessoensis TaxID=6573 RepID=A0A210Q7K9_MIZYE|nr:Sulfotransferase family cytosolic 1B member 1 [Mizuhopecten yessoensis]